MNNIPFSIYFILVILLCFFYGDSRPNSITILFIVLFYHRQSVMYSNTMSEEDEIMRKKYIIDDTKTVMWVSQRLFVEEAGLILHNNQLDAQFFVYVYFYCVHVSGRHVPIIRRIIVLMRHLVYVTLCRWPSGMQVNLHTRQPSTQSDINQVSHWYNNYLDDGHMPAINIHEKLCVKLAIYNLQGSCQDARSTKHKKQVC